MLIKLKVVKDAMFWFDVDLFDMVYCQNEKKDAALAFSAICQIFCNEYVLLNRTITPADVVQYFNAFTEDNIVNAVANHKVAMNVNSRYAFIYKTMLDKAKKYNNQAIELSKKQ